MKKIIAIIGPTCTGKSELALILAKRLSGEIISADSMQIYKGMDILTSKPSQDEMKDIPHRLIDIIEPTKTFSVQDFVSKATIEVEDIIRKNKLPILVGGTGLYINSLLNGTNFLEEDDNKLESHVNYEEKSIDYLNNELKKIDPDHAKEIDKNNKKRLIRAIKRVKLTGKTFNEQKLLSKPSNPPYHSFKIGLTYKNRGNLYEKIEDRVDKMMNSGLVDEVKGLYEKKCLSKTAREAIGYKEFLDYFSGEISLDKAICNLKLNTRHYAKRQLTWFNRDKYINWHYRDLESLGQIINVCLLDIENFLNI